jgi:hypothetical protein
MTLERPHDPMAQAERGGDDHHSRPVEGFHDHSWRRTDRDPHAVLLVYECGVCHVVWAM